MIALFGEWLPDQPDYQNSGATIAMNVYPRTEKSYGPIAGLTEYSSATVARGQGLFSCLDTAGNTNVFAGDATKLYRLTSSGTIWEDVSRATGYTTAVDEAWYFLQYGQRVLTTNFANEIQSYVIGSSTDFANLSASAPKARYIAAIKNFVFVGNTFDTTDGSTPNRVWWSGYDDPTLWPIPGTAAAAAAQSDFQDIPDGGWVQGVVGSLGTADGAVFLENRIVRVTYIGPPAVFQFDAVEGARGTPAPGSIAQLGAVVFYLGEDGFYAFDGSNSTPIGAAKVDKTFFNDLNQQYFSRISAAVDPINKLVFWSYPGQGSSDGTPNKVIIYNWQLGRWATAELNHQILGRSQSFGQTLESLDNISTNLDALPFSLDSRAWTGGKLILSAFSVNNKLSYLNGPNLAATIETTEIDGGNGQRVYIDGFRPMVDGGSLSGTVRYRNLISEALTTKTATTPSVGDGIIYNRISARYIRARVSIDAGGTWAHAMGVEPIIIPDGAR